MPQDWKSSLRRTFCLGFQAAVRCLFELTQGSRKGPDNAKHVHICPSDREDVSSACQTSRIFCLRVKRNLFLRKMKRKAGFGSDASSRLAAAKSGSENTCGWPEVWGGGFVAWLSDRRGVCATVTSCQTHRDSSVSSDVSGSSLCGSGIISKP